MLHKDLMVGCNPHFENKNSYLKSVKGIGDGNKRYVVSSKQSDQQLISHEPGWPSFAEISAHLLNVTKINLNQPG